MLEKKTNLTKDTASTTRDYPDDHQSIQIKVEVEIRAYLFPIEGLLCGYLVNSGWYSSAYI